jgi:hypothetical protein
VQVAISKAELEMLKEVHNKIIKNGDPREPWNIIRLREDFNMFMRKLTHGKLGYCSMGSNQWL